MNVAAPIKAARAANQLVNTALARNARTYPSTGFARDGFVVVPGFLSPGDATAALADVARFGDREVTTTGVPRAAVKDRADRQRRDLNVRQVTGVDRLSPVLAELARSRRVEAALAELTGLDLRLGRLVVQIDWPDARTKRGLHVDSHWPPTYKAFVYLTPVRGPENGPFSVVPGSHRDRLRKVRAIAGNYRHGRVRTDLDAAYSLEEARCLLGEPGTAIFSDQRLAHAGWPEHTTGTRFMLVAYLYEQRAR